MRTRLILGCLIFLCAFALAVPAGAVNINGVEYLLFARCKIGLENGQALQILGNVAVNEDCGTQHGFLHIGVDNLISGNANANRIFFGTNSNVNGVCTYNASAGGSPAAVCGTNSPGTFTTILPAGGWPSAIPLPIPSVTPGVADVTCTGNLAAGNYRDISVPDGATCTLLGTVNARSFTVGNGATLNGGGAALNLTGGFVTEPAAKINDTNVTSVAGVQSLNPAVCSGANGLGTSAEVIETGFGAVVKGSVFYAPCARIHLHQGGSYSAGFEAIAILITVEPVLIKDGVPDVCACVGRIEKDSQTNTIALSNGCHLNASGLSFFVTQTCATVCPGPNCTAASLANPPAPTDDTATLNIPVVPVGGSYHVMVTSAGGQFCTATTVPLP